MEGDQAFHGFSDAETVRTHETLHNKLNQINKKLESESNFEPELNVSRRPANRFLKGSPSSSSSSSSAPRNFLAATPTKSASIKITSRNSAQLQFESLASSILEKRAPQTMSCSVAKDIPSKQAQIRVPPPLASPKRVNNFLKPNSKSPETSAIKVKPALYSPSQVKKDSLVIVSPNKMRQAVSQPVEPIMEAGTVPMEYEMDTGPEEMDEIQSLKLQSASEGEKTDDKIMPKTETGNGVASQPNSIRKLPPLPKLQPKPPSPLPVKIAKQKQQTPSKSKVVGTGTAPELNFVASRSKRKIVPNKRFFSEDGTPVAPKSAVIQANPEAVSAPVKNTPAKGKKRTLSGGDPKPSGNNKRSRALSLEVPTATSSINTDTKVMISTNEGDTSADLNGRARSRRTIIPNRKFIDEEEAPKEPAAVVAKKLPEQVTSGRTRKKSEKDGNNKVEADQKPVVPPSEDLKIVLKTATIQRESEGNGCDSAPVKARKSQPQINGDKTSVVKKNGVVAKKAVPKPEVEDELPVDKSDLDMFQEKPIYMGACIVKDSEVNQPSAESKIAGIICCGICGQVKKYRLAHEKRKRGSFMCDDCGEVVVKIFQIAMKAQSYSTIIGPPVCSGWCTLTATPVEQFCQACYGRTCLINLPLKDDVYFKIWRAIPPMSRGCVPTAPVVNEKSPNVGKVVVVNDSGEVLSASASFKLLRIKSTDPDVEDTNEDLNQTDSSSTNGESIPQQGTESSLLSTALRAETPKLNGVAAEEIVLGRQTGQERARVLVDPILKTDLDDIASYGFPVVVGGPSFPRKPLCFLCGSSGIEQLIYCSMCCEPYHPYCSGDELLMDTYLAVAESNGGNLNSSLASEMKDVSKNLMDWKCRRCISCVSCDKSIGTGRNDLIRCSECRNPYHLQTCIDKPLLNKLKKLDKLKKVWSCESCLKCRSCAGKIEANRRVQTLQQAAAIACSDDEDTEDEGDKLIDIMLCANCSKQRKKGSYCPICDACYDDNDWESKMMECSKCNRWIHHTCEKMTDDQYQILGLLDESIEYVCKLCYSPPATPVWYEAIQSLLNEKYLSALTLFEEKAVNSLRMRKEATTINIKPTYVVNLFREEKKTEVNAADKKEEKKEKEDEPYEPPTLRNRRSQASATTPQKKIRECKVKLRDFVKYPKTVEENMIALKILGVEILRSSAAEEDDRPTTPLTPVNSPSKQVASIANSIREILDGIDSLHTFHTYLVGEIEESCETDEEVEVLKGDVSKAMKETFSWFVQQVQVEPQRDMLMEDSDATTDVQEESSESSDEAVVPVPVWKKTNPFQEVFWKTTDFFDDRICVLCGEVGDFPPDLSGRLLWCGVNEWIHCNCAIWSSEVYEEEDGALKQLGNALNRGKMLRCKVCNEKGATVSCCHSNCKNSYHFPCARKAYCALFEDKTMHCPKHSLTQQERQRIQQDMKVGRKVFVDLDYLYNYKKGIKVMSDDIRVFIGSLKIERFGSILPISVREKGWENSTYLIPKEYVAQRIFWSVNDPCQKESYAFSSTIDGNNFPAKVNDIRVNIVVDHSASNSTVQRALDGIKRFNQWLKQAPRYIDEEKIEWLPPCTKEFYRETSPIDMDIFSRSNNGGAPSLASSLESFIQIVSKASKRKRSPDVETTSNSTGYASSSTESSLNDTPESAKRRRSLSKTRKSPRKKMSLALYESPRRQSMRNRILQNVAGIEEKVEDRAVRECDDSDNDSGILELESPTESCDEKPECAMNLLSQFDDSLELEQRFLESPVEELSSPMFGNVEMEFDENMERRICKAKLEFTMSRNQREPFFKPGDAKTTWMLVFGKVSQMRPLKGPFSINDDGMREANSLFMLGLTHPSVQFITEQLPGIAEVVDQHKFKYSPRPYINSLDINCPVALNSAGSARGEGFSGRKPVDMFGWLASKHRKVNVKSIVYDESTTRVQGLPIAMQFRDLGKKAKKRFVVLHSDIHGRGLFSRCDVEKGEMLIEYAGEVIRAVLTDLREKYYESRGIGCYMFRMKTQVIDATMKGNAARFINHSCEPNCEAKTMRILGNDHIIIFALRKIFKGEELTYDYKFEREDVKIPCSCGAPKCRKYMN